MCVVEPEVFAGISFVDEGNRVRRERLEYLPEAPEAPEAREPEAWEAAVHFRVQHLHHKLEYLENHEILRGFNDTPDSGEITNHEITKPRNA